jgi:ribosomal protein L23
MIPRCETLFVFRVEKIRIARVKQKKMRQDQGKYGKSQSHGD